MRVVSPAAVAPPAVGFGVGATPAVPSYGQTSAAGADGFKFPLGAEVEYFIPDEDLYWSFGWLRGLYP